MAATDEVVVGDYLSLRFVEDLLAGSTEMLRGTGDVRVDLSRLNGVQVGAGWRLGAFLRLLALERRLLVDVPEWAVDTSNRFSYLNLRRSGLAHSIARRADVVRGSDVDVTEPFRSAWFADAVTVGQNSVSVVDLPALGDLVSNNFEATVAGWLSKVNVTEQMVERRGITALFVLIRETIENVLDHANRRPLRAEVDVSAQFSMSYYKSSEPSVSAGPGNEFMARMKERSGDQDLVGIIEVTVMDDGVGLAARHSLDETIVSGPFERERKVVERALLPKESIKRKARDSVIRGGEPGLGSQFVAESIETLGGYCEIRTGRAVVQLDTTLERRGFHVSESPLGVLPGTLLRMVVPLHDPQMRLGV